MLKAVADGTQTIRILSDDTNVFVLLVYWTSRMQVVANIHMEKWNSDVLNVNETVKRRNTALSVRNSKSTSDNGSKGAFDTASNTTCRSHKGTIRERDGRSLRAPLRNWLTRGCEPVDNSFKASWPSDVAATYPLNVDSLRPTSKRD
ncbi:unnamed protein product [Merluccius merluccius]